MGCGTSALGGALEARGFDVRYCDFSREAIAFWRRRRPAAVAHYVLADVRALPYADGAFAFAVDKGCLDALAFGGAGAPARQLAPALAELARVLAPRGTLHSFSTDPPELRLDALRDAAGPDGGGWELRWTELDEDDALPEGAASAAPAIRSCAYFLYSLTRRADDDGGLGAQPGPRR